MSVCALMTVSVLGSVFGGDLMADTKEELKAIGREICTLTASLSSRGSCGLYCFSVPFLPSGEAVGLVLNTRSVTVRSSGESVVLGLPSDIHTWGFEGQALNASVVRSLDDTSDGIEAISGDDLGFCCVAVVMEDDKDVLLFARLLD